jgi:hypothetical protein
LTSQDLLVFASLLNVLVSFAPQSGGSSSYGKQSLLPSHNRRL